MKGKKGTKAGFGFGFSYDCPICGKRHREGSSVWEKHLPHYEKLLKNKRR